MYKFKKYKMKRHPFKRMRVRFRNWKRSIDKRLSPQSKNSEVQELALGIVRRAIVYKNSNLLIAPVSGDRYIHYDDIFIKLETQRITIINGTYTYDVAISYKDSEKLVDKFNYNLEITRKKWENIIRTKTERSLRTIYTELINNNNK